jgi:hypothetical protein
MNTRAEVQRLLALDAAQVREDGEGVFHMTDPDGNGFLLRHARNSSTIPTPPVGSPFEQPD